MERPKMEKPKSEYQQKILDVRRVARVMAGGRRFSFRVTIAIGNKKGKVGVGTAKGQDVTESVEKAVRQAKKNLIQVKMKDDTIPHEIFYKFKSAKVLLKPARKGAGIIAGGAVRAVCDLAGVKNVSGKITGRSSNMINNSLAAIGALKSLRLKNAPIKQKTESQLPVPVSQ